MCDRSYLNVVRYHLELVCELCIGQCFAHIVRKKRSITTRDETIGSGDQEGLTRTRAPINFPRRNDYQVSKQTESIRQARHATVACNHSLHINLEATLHLIEAAEGGGDLFHGYDDTQTQILQECTVSTCCAIASNKRS